MNPLRAAAAIVASTGLVTLGIGYFLLQDRLATVRKWRPVDAQVIRTWLNARQSGDTGNQSISYIAHYELAYTVDGQSIRSNALSEDEFFGEAGLAQRRLDRHGPGTRGLVHVNPNDPKQVRLNLGRNVHTLGLSLWLVLAAVFLFMIGASLWLMGAPTISW
jgi:hypothetical protein